MNKILVTPRSITQHGHPSLELLKKEGYEIVFSTAGKQPDEDELIRLLPGCIGMLAGVEKITEKVLESAKDLKVISRNGTGIDNIDLKAAERLNIKIVKADGANARGVAELTIGLIFSLTRAIPYSCKEMKDGKWTRKQGIEIQNKVLGLIGCGKVGKIVAELALGLGMRVIAYDLFVDNNFKPSDKFKYVALENIYKESDIISLHCPMQEDGKPVINKDVIVKMKKGVYLINTARAGVVDDNAILEGLNNSIIAGYATDVYNEEPPKLNDLHKHDNVILTPHLGGYTVESVDNAATVGVHNLLKELEKYKK